jgi:prevent-host-death family protein
VKTINISSFKARCIALLKDVQKSHEPIIVTLRGKPLAQIEPVGAPAKTIELGTLKNTGAIRGEIIYTDWDDEWEMNQP